MAAARSVSEHVGPLALLTLRQPKPVPKRQSTAALQDLSGCRGTFSAGRHERVDHAMAGASRLPSRLGDQLGAAPAARTPNVLFIAIDDLNDWVGCLGGHPQAQTPNMDRLAARGTLFRNAHCQAPLCNPSRASLLTGLRPSTTGIYGLAPGIRDVARTRDCVTLPQYFARHGYFTATFGKVFHDGSIPERLQTNEFNVWGPAPGMPLPQAKFVTHSGQHAADGLGRVSRGRPRAGGLEDRRRGDCTVEVAPDQTNPSSWRWGSGCRTCRALLRRNGLTGSRPRTRSCCRP